MKIFSKIVPGAFCVIGVTDERWRLYRIKKSEEKESIQPISAECGASGNDYHITYNNQKKLQKFFLGKGKVIEMVG
jgi:hypothetical protein